MHRLIEKLIKKRRQPLTITSRVSSVTNVFVQAIIPSVKPTEDEVLEALTILGASPDHPECVYCGAPATDWDHLRPFVKGRRPTGYIDEIRNLVPSCSTCNNSKGGQDWETWMQGSAAQSPAKRGVKGIPQRIARLHAFEAWGNVQPIDLAALVGEDVWNAHWNRRDEIEKLMFSAQAEAKKLRSTIRAAMGKTRPGSARTRKGPGGPLTP
ncbi:HNH endonuclease [Oleispirillum naphthae]|uniref:HNH endonuclease n=1 Tax=Oleispirillum naphthae TaxID=2838853 RepID=UPI0030822323